MSRLLSRGPARSGRRGRWLLASTLCALVAATAEAHSDQDAFLKEVAFDQRLGEQVPLALTFRDETGRTASLQSFLGEKPAILLLSYFRCTMLCPLLLDGLVKGLRDVRFTAGEEFRVLAVSIDPRETPELAATRKALYVARYDRPGSEAGWRFLTGEAEPIRRLTQAVGFRYSYDPRKDEYAHAAGIVLLTPEGKVARYLYGVEFQSRDLRLGLVEAAAHTIGSPIDQLLLFCYHYDPVAGKYGVVVMNVVRLAGTTTVLAVGGLLFVLLRRERQAAPSADEAS